MVCSQYPNYRRDGAILYILHKVTDRSGPLLKDGEPFDMRACEHQFGDMVETMTDAVSRWDKDLKLVYANKVFRSVTGLSDDSPLG